jgi:hypothetical protein
MSYQTIPNVFTSGMTAIASKWNANYSAVISGLTDGTKDLNINNLNASNFSVVGDLYNVALTDISNTVTITGWSSFSVKKVYYKKTGNRTFLYYLIDGNSDGSGNLSIGSLPFFTNSIFYSLILTHDVNGGTNNYIGYVTTNGSIIQIYSKYDNTSYVTPNGNDLQSSGQFVFYAS